MARTYLRDVKILADNTDPYQTEPVTVDELKLYLQLEGTAYDPTLNIFIKSARRKIENHCNVSLVSKSIHATFDTHGISGMPLPFEPFDAIQKMEWKKCPSQWKEMFMDADYNIEDSEAQQAVVQSSECGLHRITYTSKALEDVIYNQAIIAQAGYMYTHRDDSTGWSAEAKALLEGLQNINY